MKVAAISANLGGYDVPQPWPAFDLPAEVEVLAHRLTDADLTPRPLAMTSRLMCGLPKWFGTYYVPGCDVYLWIDASCTPTPQAIRWFLERLDSEIAVFKHPDRDTVAEEYAFVTERMQRPKETYLNSRYAGEWIEEQFAYIVERGGAGLPLYASTAFAYRPTPRVIAALAECFTLKARFCLHDQFAFPFVLHQHGCAVTVIPDNYLTCPALVFTRKRR